MTLKKFLFFRHGDDTYCVHEDGNITIIGNAISGHWKFLGVSFHHWKQSIDINCEQAFQNPKSIIGGLVWDNDHGTIGKWSGRYNGKLPRITSAWIN
jgi:hypothetical protein